MTKGRLEAFSDGVIAILITVMVLELKTPHAPTLPALREVGPTLLAYVLSFVFLGIYWNNHHHLLHAASRIDARVMWANHHLLFWLSLVPFTTAFVGEFPRYALPTALYGLNLLFAGFGWLLLQRSIVGADGPESKVAAALGRDLKGPASALLYLLGVGLSLLWPLASDAVYLLVALLWLVPDRRFEQSGSHARPPDATPAG